jgi:hypothetical protein
MVYFINLLLTTTKHIQLTYYKKEREDKAIYFQRGLKISTSTQPTYLFTTLPLLLLLLSPPYLLFCTTQPTTTKTSAGITEYLDVAKKSLSGTQPKRKTEIT